MIDHALVTNAGTRFGRWTAELLAPLAKRLTVVSEGANEADWESLDGPFDLIAHCPHPFLLTAGAEDILVSSWLALKHSHRLMAAAGGGILVTQCLAGETTAELEAALYGHRLSATAALLDAMKVGLNPRANRLVFNLQAREDQFKAALGLLVDERSTFMTGAELILTTRPEHPPASDRLDGKTVLVTGATSGIGRATAIEIGRLGGFAAIGGRKVALAEETLELVRAAGGDGMIVPLDVTDEAAWEYARTDILAKRGGLDGLVNNAGESRNLPIAELASSDFQFLLAVNYRGTLLGMRACLGPIAARGGAILNISSVAGVRAVSGGSAYGGSKASVVGLSLAFAAANRDKTIRINPVQPGLIWSDSVADSLGEKGAQAFRAMIEPKTPIGRVGVPADVAKPLAFLLSDAAAPISGQAISISGGLEFNVP